MSIKSIQNIIIAIFIVIINSNISFSQTSDTLVLDVKAITKSNRDIIQVCCYNTPGSIKSHTRQYTIEAYIALMNSTIYGFEYLSTYDITTLSKAKNLLEVVRASLTQARFHKEATSTHLDFIENELMPAMEAIINKALSGEKLTARIEICGIQGKYYNVSKTIGLPALTAFVMVQNHCQMGIIENVEMK